MKKIGILTLFYNNINYGAVLQAYALCKVLNDNGYMAEQISYKNHSTNQPEGLWHKIKRKGLKSILVKLADITYCKLNRRKIAGLKRHKLDALQNFTQEIVPHTEKVYTNETIGETIDLYDAFITGSDQVWNGYNYAYYLDFVPPSKVKISYAPSIARSSLSKSQRNIFQKSLSTFDSISVREAEAVDLLKDAIQTTPELVADPTLLLSASDWDAVGEECNIGDDYVLCYFLGENFKAKKLAKKFAVESRMKTVFVPINYGIGSVLDSKCADISLNNVTPGQFIYLIKNAKYVFTDSFHAMVFSFLFKKQFFVFKRNKRNEMSSRISNIAEFFKASSRVCFADDRENLHYIKACTPLNYEDEFTQYENLKARSLEFLFGAVEGK